MRKSVVMVKVSWFTLTIKTVSSRSMVNGRMIVPHEEFTSISRTKTGMNSMAHLSMARKKVREPCHNLNTRLKALGSTISFKGPPP